MTEAPATQDLREAPVVDWFDQAEMMNDPYPAFERMRALGPVVSVPLIGRHLLTTFHSVLGAEQHPELFSAHASRPTMVRALGARPMLRKDDAAVAVERSGMNSTLRPRTVTDQWASLFRANVEQWREH